MAKHTTHTLIEINRALDTARLDPANRCQVVRKDARGRTSFHVEKPRARPPRMGAKADELAYGVHGVGYLVIDADTLKVTCGACSGELDATATPPADSLEGKAIAIEAAAPVAKAG